MPGGYQSADSTRPASRAAAVTFSDAAVIENTRGLWVGSAGNVAVKMFDTATTVIFQAVPAGTLLPIQVTQVLSTGTTVTAGTVLALW